MSHSSCPTKLPDDVCHIRDEFRQALHDNAERPYRTPTPEEGEEDTTPAWREHILCSPAEPALVRNTHAHISKQANETIELNIAHVFHKGEPIFLVNSKGSGKTATLLQGLRKHWGFYFSSCLRDFGSADFWEISAESWFNRVILARLLLLHVFAETLGARDIWNSVQLSFQRGSDYPVQLWTALARLGPVSSISDREREIMRDTVSSLRVLLGNVDFHLFCVFDDSELAQERRFGEGIDLDWKSGLSFRGYSRLPTLPPSLVASDAKKLLLERAGAWLRGRHKLSADFVQFLLKGSPMTVFDAPHTCLHNFLRWKAHFIPHDEMQLVADKETDGTVPLLNGSRLTPCLFEFISDLFLHRILYQYLILGHSKFANLGPEYSWLVYRGLGYFADDKASQVVIDEPMILLIYNPDQLALASAREHAVLLLSRIFATPRGPAEAFIFPGEDSPEWAHRYSDLVELRPGVWNTGDARYRTARHADYPASAVLPLATDGTSYATTLSWLRHEHETAFCLLPDPTALIFALRRFDGDYLWVIVRVGPSANCGPRKSGLGRYFVSEDKTADTSEALSLLASLPNPCKALGDLPVLEVAMPIPDPNAPNRLERLNHRRYESPYGSPRSPRPTKVPDCHQAVLEEAMLTEREDEESWILSRMVANFVGETSISPDRHGRRRKVAAVLEDSPSNPSSVASSQHGTQLELRDASHVLSGNASKRKRSEASMESDPTADELPPACKRSRVDSWSPTP
ncbi:hypothetical protein K525DRAFT_284251 [Schizophyllum commune Loenen D]|nr:hypothetical protein K525DRAFT_284251 [Schizophyllum commune Loenen D]